MTASAAPAAGAVVAVTGALLVVVALTLDVVVAGTTMLTLVEVEVALGVVGEEVTGLTAAAASLYRLARFLHQSRIIQISKSVTVREEPASMMKFVIPVGVQS